MQIPEAILFDLDGVLLDTEEINKVIWEKVIRKIDLNLSPKQIKSFQGRSRKDCATILSKYSKGNKSYEDIIATHLPIFKGQMKEIKSLPNAKELLFKAIDLKIKLAIVTSSSSKSFERKAKQNQWLYKINEKVLGDDCNLKKGKPFPDPYLLAASNLKVDIKNCWAVEDSIAGFYSAFESGSFVFCYDRYGNLLHELNLDNFDINHPKIKFVKDHKNIIDILLNLKTQNNKKT